METSRRGSKQAPWPTGYLRQEVRVPCPSGLGATPLTIALSFQGRIQDGPHSGNSAIGALKSAAPSLTHTSGCGNLRHCSGSGRPDRQGGRKDHPEEERQGQRADGVRRVDALAEAPPSPHRCIPRLVRVQSTLFAAVSRPTVLPSNLAIGQVLHCHPTGYRRRALRPHLRIRQVYRKGCFQDHPGGLGSRQLPARQQHRPPRSAPPPSTVGFSACLLTNCGQT